MEKRITYNLKTWKFPCYKIINRIFCNWQLGSLTYWVGKCHKISNCFCNYQTGSLTCWEWENATRPSATGVATVNQNHIHPESRQIQQHYQGQVLQLSNRITYSLTVGKCPKTISNCFSNVKQDYLLAESRQMPQKPCQEVLHMSNRITYSLPETNATRLSVADFATIKQDHLHTESRKMPQGHWQQFLQLSNRITYILRTGKCHKTISNRSCKLYLSNRITYSLRAGKCHKTIRSRCCNCETGSLTPWQQANATRPSAVGVVTVKQDHLQAESRQIP
jgi:hypothetical protein